MITSGLHAWTECDWSDGIQIDELRELESLSVRTRNSRYEIIVTSPASGDILVRGGTHFPEFTPVHLCGSTNGGTIVKLAAIHPGLRLEFEQGGRHIVTSTVLEVEILAPRPTQ